MSNLIEYTEPKIITSSDIKKRSYIEFYLNSQRIRIGNGDTLNQKISPNRAKSLEERVRLLKKLHYELQKALEANNYPVQVVSTINTSIEIKPIEVTTIRLLFNAIRTKLRAKLSKKYKRNLKSIYRQFRDFLTETELQGSLNSIKVSRIDSFLSQFGSTGTYYMNKRRDLGVLFSAGGRLIDTKVEVVKTSERRKTVAILNIAYEKEQLKPIFNYLKANHPKLYVCCLLTYSSWLRPHEEIRMLTPADFKKNNTEVHLTGGENKGGKVRVVYIPDYVRAELSPILADVERNNNIFSGHKEPFNESYFNTQWSRAYKKMVALGLIYENQTIYSFRHTAAVDTYRRTKDVYLLQKLFGHSSILVTLKYLRSLGEFNSEEMRDAAPQL